MTRSRKRRRSDMDPGGQGNQYPQNKCRKGTSQRSRPGRRLDSNSPLGFRKSRGDSRSRSRYDRHSPQRVLTDSYRPHLDSYRPRPIFRPPPSWDSYRPDSSGSSNSRAATNKPVTRRAEDSVGYRGRSPPRRCRQREASDQPSLGRVTRKPLPDGRDRNGFLNDARSRSPRSRDHANGPVGSQRFRDGSRRSPLNARKRISVEVRNGRPGDNTKARNISESSLGKNTSVTSQPDTNVPDLRGSEGSRDDTSYPSDSRAISNQSVYSQGEGVSGGLEKSGVLPILRFAIPIPKLEPSDFLPESRSEDRGLYLKAGTPGEICVWKPESASTTSPNDSNWRTADFTPSIRELVHGRARQAKNRASAALLPENVPLFKPKTRPGHLRPQKPKFRGTLQEYYQMLSDKKEKKDRDDETTLSTSSSEEDDPNLSSSSDEEEDYDPNTLRNPQMLGLDPPQPKSQWRTPPGIETQAKSKNGLLSKDSRYASAPSESTNKTPLVEAKNGPSLARAQVDSENSTLTKDTLGAGSLPNGGTQSIAPIKKLAIARGKQLRPELVQAMARLRASASQSVDPGRECAGGPLPVASEGLHATAPEISSRASEKEGVLDAPNKE
ncbi:hypothetical protein B9Z19DRAFT_1123097 [Tuber borchii]|uniref:Uncharacterized protein n=1 Tax=Tuber borchii TaxID=42251 RepID=A0A2T6ZZ68_TUBBO|nr:hypothetical protein B9Z19DRAFT_1123097 [Tuber borchii]